MVWVFSLLADLVANAVTIIAGEALADGRPPPGSVREVARLNPRSVVVWAELAAGSTIPQSDPSDVVLAIVANRRGLSFRTGWNHEILLVEAARIGALVPLPGDAVRVECTDGFRVDFVLMEQGVDVEASLSVLRDATGAAPRRDG